MPDWSYQTVFRRLLFRLPPKPARSLALMGIGTLGRLPCGNKVIDYMGHMVLAPQVAAEKAGLTFHSHVGLGTGIDVDLQSVAAFERFGFGYLEIGPVHFTDSESGPVTRTADGIRIEDPQGSVSVTHVLQRLPACSDPRPLRLIYVDRTCGQHEAADIVRQLSPVVDAFVLRDEDVIRALKQQFPQAQLLRWLESASEHFSTECLDGAVLDNTQQDNSRTLSRARLESTITGVREVRKKLPSEFLLVAKGGIHEPGDAVRALQAGADLVSVDSGFVFSGPGLAKRINAATLGMSLEATAGEPTRESWFWASLMGIAMFLGGIMAIIMAVTRVVLPYDERYLGITRDELMAINARLLDFMKHDRVTLAGTMLSLGILYMALALFGMRRGRHWAQQTVIYSAFVGFFSFFFFLGFGYFDPFHAFVTTILFQFLLLTVYAKLPHRTANRTRDLWNDAAWRRSQWGQLLYVVHGAILIVAGAVISFCGMTSVFVPEDLEFLCTTADNLLNANPQLVPVVAHDRATFGGMLIAVGVAVHLMALWGFARGARWVWWSLLLAGLVAYSATIWVHAKVGYTSLKHLIPAYGGLALLIAGALLSYGYLTDTRGHALESV